MSCCGGQTVAVVEFQDGIQSHVPAMYSMIRKKWFHFLDQWKGGVRSDVNLCVRV